MTGGIDIVSLPYPSFSFSFSSPFSCVVAFRLLFLSFLVEALEDNDVDVDVDVDVGTI